jgi:hypothetical protein
VRKKDISVSRRTLETVPERTLRFLRTVASDVQIWRLLEGRGYSAADHLDGWRRLHAACGFMAETVPEDTHDADVRRAVAELDEADDAIFRVTKATLSRRYPTQAAFVLGGIERARGRAWVLALEILLDRVDALELGTGRDLHTHADDVAALAELERRVLGRAERDRLRALIAIAKHSRPVSEPAASSDERDRRLQDLARLRDWYVEWSEIAHASVERRDFLVRLGLATQRPKRRGKLKSEAGEAEA